MKKTIIKFFAILVLSLPTLFFFNTSFTVDPVWKTLQTIIFAVVLGAVFSLPNSKKYFLLLSLALIILMAALSTFKFLDWAEIFGSSGLGILVVTLLGYTPEIFKKGYIEKL